MPSISEMIASYSPLNTNPTLFSGVSGFLNKNIKDYHNPTDAQRKMLIAFFTALKNEDVAGIAASVARLGLTAYREDDNPNTAMYRSTDISEFPILYYHRFGRDVNNVILEDPHNLHDLVFRLSTAAWASQKLKARCMLSNATTSDCSPERAQGQKGRSIADEAHNINGWLCTMSDILTSLYGVDYPHIQLHGFIGSSNTKLQLCNQFSSRYTSQYRSICAELAYALAEVFPLDMCNTFVLGTKNLPGSKNGKPYTMGDFEKNKSWFRTKSGNPNTCVEAREINGGSAWTVGKEDKGLFVHVECRTQNFGMPRNNFAREQLIEAFALAVLRFANSTAPRPHLKGLVDIANATEDTTDSEPLVYSDGDLALSQKMITRSFAMVQKRALQEDTIEDTLADEETIAKPAASRPGKKAKISP